MPIQAASLWKSEPDPLVAGRLSIGDYKRPLTNKQHPHARPIFSQSYRKNFVVRAITSLKQHTYKLATHNVRIYIHDMI